MTQYASNLHHPTIRRAPGRFLLDVRHEPAEVSSLTSDVREGLGATPKSLPPKHFYDAHGSQLFERICETPEYYPTRTELELLERYAAAIIEQTDASCIVELGSGSERKITTVLRAVDRLGRCCTYVPFDVSRSMLEQSGRALLQKFPWLSLHGIVGDYDKDLDALPRLGPTLFMFLGGTIGNFTPEEAVRFLTNIAAHMGAEDHLLLGTDLVKDSAVLDCAYNDSQGITAAFNKNVLTVINRRLGARFDLDTFDHVAFFASERSQIEMYLESKRAQVVPIQALAMEVEFAAGERILTEISRKFTRSGVQQLLRRAGLELTSWLSPANGYFGLSVAKRA